MILLPSIALAFVPAARLQERVPVSVPQARPAGLASSTWQPEVEGELRAAEYRFAVLPGEAATWSAPNRAQGVRMRLSASGIEIEPRERADLSSETWRLALGTKSFGRPGELLELDAGVVKVSEARAEIERGSLIEWFENDERGIEHGWTISAPPAGAGELLIVLAVEGDLALEIDADANAATFADGAGVARLGYRGLAAWDASGRTLAARLVSVAEGPAVQVDDAGARYPITVDPLLTGPFWFQESDQAHSWLGSSVAGAGDVNGDGFSDVIVAAQFFDLGHTNEGCAFVYHGSATGLPASSARTLEGNVDGAQFGFSSATAGDVNGDGYSDVIVGAPFSNSEGRAYVYHGSASGLASTPSWVGSPGQASAEYGYSVAGAGDVNGDGYSDVVVGAIRYVVGGISGGAAFVYLGSASGLATSPVWTASSSQASADFGYSVAGAGDVNGDGFGDVVVGVRNHNGGNIGEGRALLYHGTATGLAAVHAWAVESNQTTADMGGSVACAGDVNGDGFADVIVATPRYDNGQMDEGRAWVYHGAAGGLATTPAWTAESNQPGAAFGGSVSTAGDVNGDGYSDVVVGAGSFDDGLGDDGRAFVYLGSPTGLATSAVWTTSFAHAGARLQEVGTAGDVNGDGYSDVIAGAANYGNGQTNEGAAFVFLGGAQVVAQTPVWTALPTASQRFGQSVATAGDVNGDGFSDVLVGAPLFEDDDAEFNEGRAYLYLGTANGPATTAAWSVQANLEDAQLGNSVASAGDVNGDGYSDVVIGAYQYTHAEPREGRVQLFLGSASGLSTVPAWTVYGGQANAALGIQVACAGDVNGDGFSDVIVGGPYSTGPIFDGRTFVYLGSASGLATTPAWTGSSGQSNSFYGDSVASAGDVNGDGYSDVIVGAKFYDNGQADEGRAYVYLGSPGGLATTPAWTAESNANAANFGDCVASAGDVNGDGYSDVIVGTPDYFEIDGSGGAYVYHGSASGLSTNPVWIVRLAQPAHFGVSVASAGDVDADGYSDVIVGAELFDNGHDDEGIWILYRGSASGLSTPALSVEGNAVHAQLGVSVATAGDVNGDGYSDVITGADRDFDFGKARVHLGNGGARWLRAPLQRRVGGGPLALFGLSDLGSSFRLKATFAHGFTGFEWATPGTRSIRLEWEVEPIGAGSAVSGSGTPLPLLGAPLVLDEVVTGLAPQKLYRWRARFRTDDALLPVTPWFSIPSKALTEAKLRTPSNFPLPPVPRQRPPLGGGDVYVP